MSDTVPPLAVQMVLQATGGGTTVAKGGSSDSGKTSGGSSGSGVITERKAKRLREEADDRKDDRRKRDKKNDDGDGTNLYSLRADSYICYAWSSVTHEWYVGYSGGGSEVTSFLFRSESDRRINRVRPVLIGTQEVMGRNIYQCAEVAALNVALSYGEHERNLIFITFNGRGGGIVNPCGNCLQWIGARCLGYIGRDYRFHG